ncbi:MAG: Ig-like domain-containing protein, partial [Campylobacterota bacterium]|nr:Ig-like domain-containing protein [Campylobacterota bacterium]
TELDVLANDINYDDDNVTIKSVSTPTHGEVVITDSGVIEYTSTIAYVGEDSFTYVSTDGINDSNATLVSITVQELGANEAPVAFNDTATIVMNAQNSYIDVLENDIDEDGDIISIYSLTQPVNGTVVSVEEGIEYTPNRDFVGTDSFTYIPSDGKESGMEATVHLEVTNENIAPIGLDDNIELYQNSEIDIDVLANDFDQNSDLLTINIVSSTENGTIELRDGKVFYQPNQDFLGRDSFTYRPNDGTVEGNLTTVDIWIISQDNLAIEGRASFDKVAVTTSGLDYDNITQEPSRGVVVKLFDGLSNKIAETTTDNNGNYRFDNLEESREYKVRIYAQLKSHQWDISIVDNTNNQANYIMEGALVALESNSTIRDFNAISGWSSNNRRYSNERAAAPFAILDSVYDALLEFQSVDTNNTLNALLINWSPLNKAINGDSAIGYITTSHYNRNNKQLWILGDADTDTDEYDVSVITHEFGHYLKSQLSRQDSIGGNHNTSSKLDPRLAYEEGWCNAFAGIVHKDPLYIDTTG